MGVMPKRKQAFVPQKWDLNWRSTEKHSDGKELKKFFERLTGKNLWAFLHFWKAFIRRNGKVSGFTNSVIDRAYENFDEDDVHLAVGSMKSAPRIPPGACRG